MNFTVDGVRLNELLWNVILFANKTGATKGEVHFEVNREEKRLYAVACDDFIIMQDRIELVSDDLGSTDFSFLIDNASLKLLEKLAREWKETVDVQIDILSSQVTFSSTVVPFVHPGTDEMWLALTDLVTYQTPITCAPSDFYLNPDRLKNIPRMKVQGDHPVGFRYVVDPQGDEVFLSFLYGKSVRGIITSMNEQTLRDRGVAMWADPEEVEPYIEHVTYDVAETRAVVLEAELGPPWDEDVDDLQGVKAKDWKPDNLTARAEYDTPMVTEAPDHVDEGDFNEYGY